MGDFDLSDSAARREDALRGRTAASSLVDTVTRTAQLVARSMTRPRALRALAVEAASLAAHAVLYPWGARSAPVERSGTYRHYRTDELSPTQRGLVVSALAAASTPIVLVHGIIDNRSAFAMLGRALRQRGFGLVYAVNYSVLTAVRGDVRQAARRLAVEVERVRELTGSDHVHVVGHSLGGLIARYYVQRLGGDRSVRTLVTLGTPHRGTVTAHLLPTRLARQLRPGSRLLIELAGAASGCRTRFVAVWSELDEVVLPPRNARLDHPDLTVEMHRLRDVGHLSLPFDTEVIKLVVTTLTHETEERVGDTGQRRGSHRDLATTLRNS
ncbi:lipase [Longimycelium tulufanense]|uniref:Lipase n=1 Tax=Longimycelium tulufanense TaxID=907463 RepID=A0A8J3CFB5_9PSEU|nr:alpha/beta fold hydrolase [Longimycelium tulufanense]GGM58864.1 lipase [Longimycelium tulufanense]